MNRFCNWILIVSVLLGGCSLEHPYPSKEFYVLPDLVIESVAVPKRIAVKVGESSVLPPFNSRSLQYRIGDNLYEPAYYSQWAGAPGSLFTATVTRSLSSTGAVVVLPESAGGGAPTLYVSITELYADVRDPAVPLAVMAISAILMDHNGVVLEQWENRSTESASSGAPADIVNAWVAGAGDMLNGIAPELIEILTERGE